MGKRDGQTTHLYTNDDVKDGVCVKIRSSRAAAVCLALLCVLLLTAVIVLCVMFISKNENLTNEKNDLQMSLGNIKDGWIYYQSSLYFISSANEKKNWTESRRYCRERGADLIIINNRLETDLTRNISDQVWIGLTDSAVEGTWTWVDGSTLTSEFWATGQPNSCNWQDEDCAIIQSQGWTDYPCDRTFRWTCEKKIF
ncbi:CD209 antigen-like protein D [Pimephales promelas]|uniref:CD209 antigen-like protein D n=1 Tax=Pimephales promelas TaxID=90988 RepID=UPI001955957A|nr:CD209 antigen-like protein D [Pimephales promelas]KAG1935420.1 CD209 antigen-like protein C [Pimephales promelas]